LTHQGRKVAADLDTDRQNDVAPSYPTGTTDISARRLTKCHRQRSIAEHVNERGRHGTNAQMASTAARVQFSDRGVSQCSAPILGTVARIYRGDTATVPFWMRRSIRRMIEAPK